MKTTKTRIFSNKTRTSVGLVSNLDHETKKTRTRRQQMQIKIQQDFIAKKQKTKQSYEKKTHPKLMLNKPKVLENYTFIYTLRHLIQGGFSRRF
jgi:hypothetical protein